MTLSKTPKESRVIVAIGEPQTHFSPTTVILGLNEKSWEFMRKGNMTHTVDLTSLGLNIQIVLFAEETQKDCVDKLGEAQSVLENMVDLGVKEPTKQ